MVLPWVVCTEPHSALSFRIFSVIRIKPLRLETNDDKCLKEWKIRYCWVVLPHGFLKIRKILFPPNRSLVCMLYSQQTAAVGFPSRHRTFSPFLNSGPSAVLWHAAVIQCVSSLPQWWTVPSTHQKRSPISAVCRSSGALTWEDSALLEHISLSNYWALMCCWYGQPCSLEKGNRKWGLLSRHAFCHVSVVNLNSQEAGFVNSYGPSYFSFIFRVSKRQGVHVECFTVRLCCVAVLLHPLTRVLDCCSSLCSAAGLCSRCSAVERCLGSLTPTSLLLHRVQGSHSVLVRLRSEIELSGVWLSCALKRVEIYH